MNNENENIEEPSYAHMREKILALIKRQANVAFITGFSTGFLVGSTMTLLAISLVRK